MSTPKFFQVRCTNGPRSADVSTESVKGKALSEVWALTCAVKPGAGGQGILHTGKLERLTHRPSGLSVGPLLRGEAEARAFVGFLESLPIDWTADEETIKKQKAAMPNELDLVAWVEALRAAEKLTSEKTQVERLLATKAWAGSTLSPSAPRKFPAAFGNCLTPKKCAEEHEEVVVAHKRYRDICEVRHLVDTPMVCLNHPSGAVAFVRADV